MTTFPDEATSSRSFALHQTPTVLYVSGTVDAEASSVLRDALARARPELWEDRILRLDFTEVVHLDIVGVAAIYEATARSPVSLEIRAGSPVHRVLQQTGLTGVAYLRLIIR